ncbi:Tripeptidyl peptidase A [Mycena sanguinolenta]|uniref:tripeptidyl-peptidase II n=1 Tax=Mycena sanguinolenta TaxID=230812 RepID=A0A8H7CWK8_9AGAR|nr:Tripeptidyl peptidase A [Mycena sanguinolenta]
MAPTWRFILATYLACQCVSASPLVTLRHSLPEVPAGWTELRDAELSPSRGLNLRFGLTQQGFPHLAALLQDTSDPSHPNYGKHLSKAEVYALSKPSDDTLALVEDWLVAHNASSLKWSSSKDSVTAVLSVSSAQKMLSTRFGVFEHLKSGKHVIRTLSYSLPQDLLPHIDFVHPTTAFFDPLRHGMGNFFSGDEIAAPAPHLDKRPVALNQSDFTSCVSVVDPPCVRKLYNIGNYTPAVTDGGNRIGVAGYLDIWARPDSLKLYLNDYIPESVGSNYTMEIVNITGPFTSIVSDEGNLDTQLAIQVAYPIPMTYYSTNSVPPYIPDQNQDGEMPGVNEPYLDFIDYVLALDEPPTVITTSYGDDEQTASIIVPIYPIQESVNRIFVSGSASTLCIHQFINGAHTQLRIMPMLFAKALRNSEPGRGVSVLFSTGDQGLGVDDLPTCIANTGNNATTFLPVFPASCPYVTSVGETQGFPQTTTAASGAGFSYYFERPLYQDAAVSAYLAGSANKNETALQTSMYNHNGRAYPDIVCIGGGAFFDYYYNRWDIGGGTSAAVPTAAGIVALLNDWRLRHRKPTLGFLNPLLYGVGLEGLVDITEGVVTGCEQPGFNATEGWDPVSGLGFFDFRKMQSLIL